MKKKIIKSAIIALIITFIVTGINLIYFKINGKLLLGITVPGGDCIAYYGFGLYILEIFTESINGSGGVSTKVSFDFISMLGLFILLFCVISAISIIVDKSMVKNNTVDTKPNPKHYFNNDNQ